MVVGAVGSVGLMLYSSRNSSQRFLQLLFTIWVLSPFLLLLLGDIVSKRWSVITRTALYWVMLVVAVGSFAIYAFVVLRLPGSIPTPVFVGAPPISWLIIAASVGMAAWISRRRAGR